MFDDPHLRKQLALLGGSAGLIGCVMYGLRSSLPLPALVSQLLFMFFGPILVVAYVGSYPFMARPRVSSAAILGAVFGVIGAAVNMMFSVVQLNNLHYVRALIRAAPTLAEKEQWRHILQGVFTVQNGLNYVADFFFDWTIFFWALLMWQHPKFGRIFTVTGLIAGGLHFGMKLITFPEPPAEAGLFDAGPLIGLWYAAVCIQILRNLKWVEDPSSSMGAVPAATAS